MFSDNDMNVDLELEKEFEDIENKEQEQVEQQTDTDTQTTKSIKSVSSDYPEGFDNTTFDIEKKQYKNDGILEKFKKAESLEKQVKDLRRLISEKKQIPSEIDDYVKNYKFDSKYNEFLETQAGKNIINEIKDLSFKNKLNQSEFNAILDYQLKLLENNRLLDTRTKLEKETENKAWIDKQKELLGNNAEKLIENGKKFLKDDFIFNSKEKELLKNVLNSGAVGIAVINKIMEYTNQNYDSIPEIPINTEAMGVPTREDLKRKYLNEKDDFKALEILELAKKNNIKLF